MGIHFAYVDKNNNMPAYMGFCMEPISFHLIHYYRCHVQLLNLYCHLSICTCHFSVFLGTKLECYKQTSSTDEDTHNTYLLQLRGGVGVASFDIGAESLVESQREIVDSFILVGSR